MGPIDEALLDEPLSRRAARVPRRAIAIVVLVAACGNGGGGGQSLRVGMEILCASDEEAGVENVAPAERHAAKSKWIDARLKNREVRDVFARIGDLPPAARAQVLVTLVARAKLDRCDGLTPGGGALPPGLKLPELGAAASGAVPLDDGAPMYTIVVSDTAVVIEGNAVVALENGDVPAFEREGGARGLMIPKVREMARALVAATPPAGRPLVGARLLVRPDAPYELFMQLIMSVKAAGLKRYDIVARRDGAAVAVPIELPDMPSRVSANDLGRAPELGMIVAVTRDKMLVFSMSGVEGTIQSPKLTTAGVAAADIARVQETLAEIHARHGDERRIVVMFDAAIPMQLVTETLAAVRAKPDGGPLFTDVMLGAGFE